MTDRKFTLIAGNWYALEFFDPLEGSGDYTFIPLLLESVIPQKTGENWLDVNFHHNSYGYRYLLRVTKRTKNLLVGITENDEFIVIRPITFLWLERYCPHLIKDHPFPPISRFQSDAQYYLDLIYDGAAKRRIFAQYDDKKLVVNIGPVIGKYHLQASVEGYPLLVEEENVLALREKAIGRIKHYFKDLSEESWKVHYLIEFEERDVMDKCALRFSGYLYQHRVHGESHSVLDGYLQDEIVPQDPLDQMLVFFLMQRYLMKWGGEHEPPNGKKWRLFREMFFRVVDRPVPLDYQMPEYYRDWLLNYEPCRDRAIQAVRKVHESTEYDDDALLL